MKRGGDSFSRNNKRVFLAAAEFGELKTLMKIKILWIATS
jgi:hypothetical protein